MGIFQITFHTQHDFPLARCMEIVENARAGSEQRERKKNSWKWNSVGKAFREIMHKSSLYFLPNDDLFTAAAVSYFSLRSLCVPSEPLSGSHAYNIVITRVLFGKFIRSGSGEAGDEKALDFIRSRLSRVSHELLQLRELRDIWKFISPTKSHQSPCGWKIFMPKFFQDAKYIFLPSSRQRHSIFWWMVFPLYRLYYEQTTVDGMQIK